MWTADRIKELRAAKRISQAKLAEACGVTVTTVSRWENGGRSPDPRACKALALIDSGISWVIAGRCAWCGKKHVSQEESAACLKSKQKIREYHEAASIEEKTLKNFGWWYALHALGQEVTKSCNWHRATSVDLLAKESGITHRNAEQIIDNVFRDFSSIQ